LVGLQLIQSAVAKIIHPEAGRFSSVTVGVLVVSILLKLWQNQFYHQISRLINSTTLKATAVDSRNDILATVAVLTALIITRVTGYNLDGYIGALVALFILVTGVKLVKETIDPLLGVAPSQEMVDAIYRKILSYDQIIGLHDLAVHNYGVAKCFATVHCEVPAEQDIMVSHDIIDNIERDFLNEQGIHMVIHLDPVVTNDQRTNELQAQVREMLARITPELSMHDFRVVWGVTHSNLIFDVVVPYGLSWSDAELVELITERVQAIDVGYRPVITVDHSYVPQNSLV
jgi:divalent metal cation (Fe/Co/Zn/Cd) transporter